MNAQRHDWGQELIWAETDLYSGRVFVIKSGERTPYSYHSGRDKTICVLQGIVMINIEGTNRVIKEGQSIQIAAKVKSRLAAIQGDATILEAGTKMEEEIIVEDDYRKVDGK